VINVGTHAAIPGIPGLEAARALTHIEALELDYLPAHLIVLGGGYVGIEMARAYRRFGSRVTIVEPGRQLMGREDADVGEEMQRVLGAEGIGVLLNARPANVKGADQGALVDDLGDFQGAPARRQFCRAQPFGRLGPSRRSSTSSATCHPR